MAKKIQKIVIKVPKNVTRRASIRVKKAGKEDETDIVDLADSVDKSHALDVLAQTEGARVLVDSIISDIISSVNVLSNRYKILSHIELVSHCADLHSNLAIMLAITRAEKNHQSLKSQLEEALKT
jgi:hypothetical protein